MATPPSHPLRPLSAIILGADALLAALPATPVQFAHACQRAGFDIALPVSWGDELIAMRCIDEVKRRGPAPTILCSCSSVRASLLAAGNDLAPFCISTVAPPVAAARYLRAIYGSDDIRVSYVGSCTSAADPAIDTRIMPREMLARFTELRIDLGGQPTVYDSIIPPDRRRFLSQLGGIPAPQALAANDVPRPVVEIDGEDYATELAQYIVSGASVVVDLGSRLGCACSGAAGNMSVRAARAALASLEPPRAQGHVIDAGRAVDLDFPLPARSERELPVPISVIAKADRPPARDLMTPPPGFNTPPSLPPDLTASLVRRPPSSAGVPRVPSSAVPTSRATGRPLPRAYVARRRSPVSMRSVDELSPPRGRPAMSGARTRVELPPSLDALGEMGAPGLTPSAAMHPVIAAGPGTPAAPPLNTHVSVAPVPVSVSVESPEPRRSATIPVSAPAFAPSASPRPSASANQPRRSRPAVAVRVRTPWWQSRAFLVLLAAALTGAAAWLAYTLL